MRLVHLSDVHLGFRQYQRLTSAGINQREADVAQAFRNAIDRTIALKPDLVLVAGDVFHNVRPTNPAILHGFAQFARLTRSLPNTLVVVVAGNHDSPRAAETGSILKLFQSLGVHVVVDKPERLSFPERDLSILAVPDMTRTTARPALTTDASARYNVLLMHGEIPGLIPDPGLERASLVIPRSELTAANWSYTALGHYHVYTEVGPNAYYSGSLEHASTTAWTELAAAREAGVAGKGIIEHDLATGEHHFHVLPTVRRWIDLRPLSARGMSAAELDAAISRAIEECQGGIDDCVIRLLARDVPRHIARELDQKVLREFRRRALHFHLDTRRPEIVRQVGHGAPSRRPSLREIVRDKLRSRIVESDLSRDALVDLGTRYLDEVDRADTTPRASVEGLQ